MSKVSTTVKKEIACFKNYTISKMGLHIICQEKFLKHLSSSIPFLDLSINLYIASKTALNWRIITMKCKNKTTLKMKRNLNALWFIQNLFSVVHIWRIRKQLNAGFPKLVTFSKNADYFRGRTILYFWIPIFLYNYF